MGNVNEIVHLCGYENLGFQEIRGMIQKYFDSKTAFTAGVSLNRKGQVINTSAETSSISAIGTSAGKPVQCASNPISFNEYNRKQGMEAYYSLGTTSAEAPSIPATGTPAGKPVQGASNPISFNEYVDGQGRGAYLPMALTSAGKSSTQPPSAVKPDPRHSLKSQQASPKQSPPFRKKEPDILLVWIILYMIHLILTKPPKRKVNSLEYDPFTGISNEELVEVFKSQRKVTEAKRLAVELKIMERSEYLPKKYVDRFRIHPKLKSSGTLDKVVWHPCSNPEVIALINDAWEREYLKMDEVSRCSYRIQRTLRIHKTEALAFIESSYHSELEKIQNQSMSADKALKQLEKIEERRISDMNYVELVARIGKDKYVAYAKRDDFGHRLHTLFTQSPKRLRPYLYFKGVKDDLYLVDLTNAQPLLFVLTLMEHYQNYEWGKTRVQLDNVQPFLQLLRKKGKNEDVIRYIIWVQQGTIYSEMHRLLIRAKFKAVEPLFNLCLEYLGDASRSDRDTLTLIQSIHSKLKPLRGLLNSNNGDAATQKVLQNLYKIREGNLFNPRVIDLEFVMELRDAIARAYNSRMTKQQKKKIKTDLCRHVFYGMLRGQEKKTNKPKPAFVDVVEKKRKPYPVLIKRVFAETFPNVWNVVESVKRFDYTDLAKILQSRESTLFVDHILRDLIVVEKRSHFLSLHDGILSKKGDVRLLMDRIAGEFKKWGLQVPLNIDNLKTGEAFRVILNPQPDVFKKRFIEVKMNGKTVRMYAKVA